MPSLVSALADAIIPELEKPFLFFGYSMGALISFELARELRRRLGIEPLQLLVAGRRAPQLPPETLAAYDAPEGQFLEEIRRLNGTPEELLNNAEIMGFLLPLLRADFELVATYEYGPEPSLTCPITAYGGLQDEGVPVQDLCAWRTQTAGGFTTRMFPGDHFFAKQPSREFLNTVRKGYFRSAKCSRHGVDFQSWNGSVMNSQPLFLRCNVQVEPLIDQWYAWSHLISPATSARNVTERHLAIMDSYISAPLVR